MAKKLGREAHSGSRLAEARRALGYTQAQLADAIGASVATIKGYEGGRRRPSAEMAEGLARLGVNLTFLLHGDGPVLLEGRSRDDQVDMAMAVAGDDEAAARRVQRIEAWGKGVTHAKWWVDETARRLEWTPKTLVREALILAVSQGLATAALHPVMVMLKGQEEADRLPASPTPPGK